MEPDAEPTADGVNLGLAKEPLETEAVSGAII
jgi:hypothetical protein